MASAVYRPCFNAVLFPFGAPGDVPPCIRHRPFLIATEILRYRYLKQKILEINRAAAIASILQDLDGAGLPADALDVLQLGTTRSATEWRDDRRAAAEIERRLRRHGWDAAAINAQVFLQAQDAFLMLDNL